MKIDLKKLFMGFSLGVFSFLGMVFLLYKMYLPAIMVIVLAFLVSRKIKVKRLSNQFRESLLYMAEEIVAPEDKGKVKKAFKQLEKEV